MGQNPIRVLAWSELTEPQRIYPQGINGALAEYLNSLEDFSVKTACLEDEDQGVSEEVLSQTDVLIWFGHIKHSAVKDEVVQRAVKYVTERGMGFLGLHSTHFAKPYKALMGTSCAWRTYVEDGQSARILIVDPEHPITRGMTDFTLPQEEWYGEPYDVPKPDSVILVGIYNEGREVARDGLVWTVGAGRVFYFRPGHETYPIYYQPEVRQIIANGVRWLARRV